MRVLLVGSFKHPMYASAFESGFRELGNEVRIVNYDKYTYGNRSFGYFLLKIQNRFHFGVQLYNYNRDIVATAKSFEPEIVFLYRCYNIFPRTVKRLQNKGYTVITYNNDDPFSGVPSLGYYRLFKRILPFADINFVYRNKNLFDYQSVGAKNIYLLLPYYLKKANYYEHIIDDIPIAFLGHFENDGRDRYIRALVDAKLPVTVFNGSDWEKAPCYEDIKCVINPGQRGKDYNDTLNRCQIALVFLSKINSDTYTRRCFEIPATKTLMMCEFSDDMVKMFPPDEAAVYFKDKDELVSKCSFLLSHPAEIKRIAENGFIRLQTLGGSEVDRCKEIIDAYNRIKNV